MFDNLKSLTWRARHVKIQKHMRTNETHFREFFKQSVRDYLHGSIEESEPYDKAFDRFYTEFLRAPRDTMIELRLTFNMGGECPSRFFRILFENTQALNAQ